MPHATLHTPNEVLEWETSLIAQHSMLAVRVGLQQTLKVRQCSMVWSIEVMLKCIQASPAQLASSEVEGKNEGREGGEA